MPYDPSSFSYVCSTTARSSFPIHSACLVGHGKSQSYKHTSKTHCHQSRLIFRNFAALNQGFQGIAVHWGQYLIHTRYYGFVLRSGVWICSLCAFAIYLDTLRVCPDKLQTHTNCKNKPTAKRSLKLFQLLRPREKFHKTLPSNPCTSLIPLLWTWLIWLHGKLFGMGDLTFRSPWGVFLELHQWIQVRFFENFFQRTYVNMIYQVIHFDFNLWPFDPLLGVPSISNPIKIRLASTKTMAKKEARISKQPRSPEEFQSWVGMIELTQFREKYLLEGYLVAHGS